MAQEENRLKLLVPEDVIVDILSRLPVNALLRFRCVCTKWRTLISSPYFTSLHLDRSNSNTSRQSILAQVFCPQGTEFIPFDPLTFSPSTYFNYGLDKASSFYRYAKFVGSINGLLCLRGNLNLDRCMYLWNPSTRMLREIEFGSKHFYFIRFGFDPIANDYKIVGFNTRNEKGVAKTGLMVWSTNLETWREINVDSELPQLSSICEVMVKEFAYWILKKGPASLVSSFNMSTEVIELVPMPDAYPMGKHAYHGVIWKGDFALAASDSSGMCQVWTMENDNVGKVNWSKKFTFQFRPSLEHCYSINLGNGKLLHNGGPDELILYDLETGIRQTAKRSCDYANGAHYHVESLISIKGFKSIVENANN